MIIFGFGRDKEGYDKNGYDREGYNKHGFDRDGYDRKGFSGAGFRRDGYDRDGYDRTGFDRDGFNRQGYNADGYDRHGFDLQGRDRNGYDRNGYDQNGYNKDGFNRDGYDKDGFNQNGLNKKGYDRNGFDEDGFDEDGYDKDGYSLNGFNSKGTHRNGTRFDHNGFDCHGLNANGLDEKGFNADGFLPSELNQQIAAEPEEAINPLVKDAFLLCEKSDFAKASELIESVLSKNPKDAEAYVAALMIEKHLTKEIQISYLGAFWFSDITSNSNYEKAIEFGSQRLKDKLSIYASMNHNILDDWIALDTDTVNNRKLIISRYCVNFDYNIPHKKEDELMYDDMSCRSGNYITWEYSAVRKWLNSTYVQSLPNYIRERLVQTEVFTPGTNQKELPPACQVPSCETIDHVFSLSLPEVVRYFPYAPARAAYYKNCDYLACWGLRQSSFRTVDLNFNPFGQRDIVYCYGSMSVNDGEWGSAYGNKAGDITVERYRDALNHGHRPAMWIDLTVEVSDPQVETWFKDHKIYYPEDIKKGAERNIAFGGMLWRVLAKTDNAALLITETLVTLDRYSSQTPVDWENSAIRQWLNNEFLSSLDSNSAARVLTKKNITCDNALLEKRSHVLKEGQPSSIPNNMQQTTEDKVFLLDTFEATRYFDGNKDRICMHKKEPSAWYLRTYNKNSDANTTSQIRDDGSIHQAGGGGDYKYGIRPALWIKL